MLSYRATMTTMTIYLCPGSLFHVFDTATVTCSSGKSVTLICNTSGKWQFSEPTECQAQAVHGGASSASQASMALMSLLAVHTVLRLVTWSVVLRCTMRQWLDRITGIETHLKNRGKFLLLGSQRCSEDTTVPKYKFCLCNMRGNPKLWTCPTSILKNWEDYNMRIQNCRLRYAFNFAS